MSYRHNPHGYYDNPREDDDEAESQRIEAIVQHVLNCAGRREVYKAFDDAREQKKLNPLIADALKIMQSRSFPKKFIEAASAALVQPGNVSPTFGTDEAYYFDGNKPPYSSDDDPGVLVSHLSEESKAPLADRVRPPPPARRDAPAVPRRRVERRLHSTDFLTRFWPQVTDSDVQNAVAISQEEGVSFYRKYKISEDDWVAQHGPDSVEDYTGSHYVKKAPRSRDEFLRSYVSLRFDAVLRVNVGRTVRELRKIDFEPDDVVYRHGGTNNSIGGASARGFYVAQLREGQLVLEGMSPPVGLGICVGGEGYRESVRNGRMTVYGIRAPSGKPKFTISVDDRGVGQVKGAANRLPGFNPGSGEFKGEAGVDEVRAVVEFLVNHLGMPTAAAVQNARLKALIAQLGGEAHAQTIDEIDNLRPGLLAMRRAGINPFSPPVKGLTWERVKERGLYVARLREAYIEARVAFDLEEGNPHPDEGCLKDLRATIQKAHEELINTGAWDDEDQKKSEWDIKKKIASIVYVEQQAEEAEAMPWEVPEQVRRLPPPPPRRRQNPDPLASYSDPEVAALALAAYERPMGGMWTYEDDEDEE